MKVKITKRKTHIQIDPSDVWNMNHTLAKIIYPMLLRLKETKQGIPHDFAITGGEEYSDQECFEFYESNTELFNKKVQEWDVVLDKMIWSFKQLIEDNTIEKYMHGEPKFDWVESDKTVLNPITKKVEKTYQMVDKNPDEHWYDVDGHTLHEERIQEGLELFGKHFKSLWD